MSGRVVCFGEVLLRLSAPGAGRLLQAPLLEVGLGGAEANVAVGLAQLGRSAAVVSVLPDNALGRAARDELRRHGVNTEAIGFSQGRMGLYFLSPGAVLRPAEVIYDRAGSAFALSGPNDVDWTVALAGASWLHLSGVTPALGAQSADAALRAVQEARRLGVKVSFDGNFRSKLWASWNGDAPAILRAILACVDAAFLDERDLGLVLGEDFSDGERLARRRRAASQAFLAFPGLNQIAATLRSHTSVDHQDIAATLATRDDWIEAEPYEMGGIVDRIGAGDAFAAGVLHGMIGGWAPEASLQFGLAAAVLKHSIPGDLNLVQEADVLALIAGQGLDVKR